MHFSIWDILVFVGFVVTVVTVGITKSRKEATDEDYFLAGRGLTWWLIGFSLIAANISTEQFVGMSGNAASHVGLAIASYEWMAAITLVVVAFGFLPYFLRAGIYTMPEFLEIRYNTAARTFMATIMILIYFLLLGSVTYSGALTIRTLADRMGIHVPLAVGSLAIGLIAMLYVAAGGLKACAWADLIQGSALILGGAVIMVFAFVKLGGVTEAARIVDPHTGAVALTPLAPDQGPVERFWLLNKTRMNMFLPKTDSVLPWTALLVGLWIPNFYYWGLNQYITQRTLGSASLAQGQRGIVFAAFLKLLIPFVIVIPGIIAFNLYSGNMQAEAMRDNAKAMTKYLKANPSTRLVETAESPDERRIASWGPGRFLLALYGSEEEIRAIQVRNPFVLPMDKAQFEALSPAPYTVFTTEDKAWANVYPDLAAEVSLYNQTTASAARAAGQATVSEKCIAYKYDTALGHLLGNVLPQGIGVVGFVLAALLGAVVSSLAAMLNAASTIFTMDIYKKFIAPKADQKAVVLLGRICVLAFTAVAVGLAPRLGDPQISNSIFTIIQESQGFISSGILAAFAFGLLVRRAPAVTGVISLLTNIAGYGLLKAFLPSIQFVNRMAFSFVLCLAVMALVTWVKPLPRPVQFEQRTKLDLRSSKSAKWGGLVVVGLTLLLYFLFSPWGLLR
jgi:SSS family solute:Na+ symporter